MCSLLCYHTDAISRCGVTIYFKHIWCTPLQVMSTYSACMHSSICVLQWSLILWFPSLMCILCCRFFIAEHSSPLNVYSNSSELQEDIASEDKLKYHACMHLSICVLQWCLILWFPSFMYILCCTFFIAEHSSPLNFFSNSSEFQEDIASEDKLYFE